MMGFDGNIWVADDMAKFMEGKSLEKITVTHHSDMKMTKSALFIYCNVVKPQIIGDRQYPLLRTVPVVENCMVETIRPQYVPVSHNFITDIEVDIRDDTGRPIPFKRGKVITTLQFRRRL